MKPVVYPGSFDPVTNGHLDIIERSSKLFDKLYVAIIQNNSKSPLFTVSERVDLVKRVTSHIPNVEVITFDGLLVDFVDKLGAKIIIKGLRAVRDYEYEFQMALMNRKLMPHIETFFLTASAQYQYLSSSIVRELAVYHGNLEGLVPLCIQGDIYEKTINNKRREN